MYEIINLIIKWIANNTQTTIALSAVVVALVTAITTIIHNRLSIRPYITIRFRAGEDSNGECILKCDILNNGLGPGIIQKYIIYFDGKKVGSSVTIKDLEESLENMILRDFFGTNAKIGLASLLEGTAVKRENKITLFEIKCPSNEITVNQLLSYGEKYFIEIHYKDLSGVKFITPPLSFFQKIVQFLDTLSGRPR